MDTYILEKKINEIYKKLNYEQVCIITKSNRPELCDLQCNDVFNLAKKYHKSPMEIGNEIVQNILTLADYSDYFSEVSFVAPGFINIKLSNKFINNALKNMNSQKFNIKKPAKEEVYFMDYGGYNIAKPLHIGHLRPTIVGEAIKRIIEYKGHKTISDVHLGDYGLQMGQVIYGILRDEKNIDEIDINYLNSIYPEISGLCKENDDIKAKCATITKELQDGSKKYVPIWEKIYAVSLADCKDLVKYLSVNFDLWEGEKDSYQYLPIIENILNDKKLLTSSEGALVVEVKKENDNRPMPPMMFRKSNGAYLYDSTDLATIYERQTKYHPEHIIYVTDFRQNLHFEQVFRAAALAEIMSYDSLEHAYNGTINGLDGKPFKTRTGGAPKLRELFNLVKESFLALKDTNKYLSTTDLDIIVNAIIKFADLSNARDKDYIFDIEKFSQVIGKTGPYILYTYLRFNKIINDLNLSIVNDIENDIYNIVDRDLRMKILELEDNFEIALKERKPHYIADYLYNLCVCANNFYQNNHISTATGKMQNDWIYILQLTNRVIKEMLNLLAIDIPSIM